MKYGKLNKMYFNGDVRRKYLLSKNIKNFEFIYKQLTNNHKSG